MDPNANLDEQLAIAKNIIESVDSDAIEPGDLMIECERLAELVLALNQWIAGGGFLPRRWAQS